MLQHEFMRTEKTCKEMADRSKDDALLKYSVKGYRRMYILFHHLFNSSTESNLLYATMCVLILPGQVIGAVEEQNK